MKKLMMLFLVVSLPALGRSLMPEVASYHFGLVKDGETFKIKTTLYPNKMLVTRLFNQQEQFIDYKSKKVSSELYQMFQQRSEGLKATEITTAHSEIVCLMMPQLFETFDHLYVDASGERLVAGPKGCHLTDHVFPKEEYAQKMADELKIMLKTLGLEMVEEIF